MAVFAWQQGNERYAKVSRFIDAFFTKFPELLKPPRHPKWKDVNLAAKVPGWTRFGPAQDALARQVTSANGDRDRSQRDRQPAQAIRRVCRGARRVRTTERRADGGDVPAIPRLAGSWQAAAMTGPVSRSPSISLW